MNKPTVITWVFGLIFICGLIFPATTSARTHFSVLSLSNALVLKTTTFSSDAVSINFEIPFAGMIIFRLFNEGEEEIWRTQGTQTRGENSILLKAEKFEQGKRYNFRIEYKGNSYSGQFEGR